MKLLFWAFLCSWSQNVECKMAIILSQNLDGVEFILQNGGSKLKIF